nr:hypothetical protein [Tanacetum cinerariifolium]
RARGGAAAAGAAGSPHVHIVVGVRRQASQGEGRARSCYRSASRGRVKAAQAVDDSIARAVEGAVKRYGGAGSRDTVHHQC